jgi:hypothetical protein
MMTIEEVNKWVSTAKKGEKTVYYKGYYAEDAFNNFEMREFSKNLLDLEKKTNLFILYQKKLKQVMKEKNQFMNIAYKKIKGGNNGRPK